MSNHSPEPWSLLGPQKDIVDASGDRVLLGVVDYVETADNIEFEQAEPADLRRIVACVNWCKEVPTVVLENLLITGKQALESRQREWREAQEQARLKEAAPSPETHVFVGMFRPEWAATLKRCRQAAAQCPYCEVGFFIKAHYAYDGVRAQARECYQAGHFDTPVYKTIEEVVRMKDDEIHP
jgi:hypothetical protein